MKVSVRDIGRTCAAQALAAGSPLNDNPYIFDLHGPGSYSTQDVQKLFEKAIGKDVEVRLVQNDQLESYFARMFQPPMAELFVEMTRSFLPGGIAVEDMHEGSRIQRGKDTLNDALGRMLTDERVQK